MPTDPRITRTLRRDARLIFNTGVDEVKADRCVYRNFLSDGTGFTIGDRRFNFSDFDRIFITGAGKATASMAAAVEQVLGPRLAGGVISVKYGHTLPLDRIRTIEAGHPVPDENGKKGAEEILKIAGSAGGSDLIICLLSGGGSALMSLPAPPITLPEKQETIRILLACGADIDEINTIRKHISSIKGGQLALAAEPATLISLILSDVVGDRLDVIASGPTVADPSRFSDCIEIVHEYGIAGKIPNAVLARLEQGAAGKISDTPKPGEPVFSRICNHIVGSNGAALAAAKKRAESAGYNTMILSSMIEGETTAAARLLASVAREIRKTGNPVPPPACILSGGETTVRVTGTGLGGRNQEFALAAAFEIAGTDNIVVLSGGTDGSDGPTEAAGAAVDSNTIVNATQMGLDPISYLENNDSYTFFKQTGDLLITGPTGTNVMDLRIILVGST